MLKVSTIFYELSAKEVEALPCGFLLLEMNTEHKTFRVFESGKDEVKRDNVTCYVSIKEPPATFLGTKTTRPKWQEAFTTRGGVTS